MGLPCDDALRQIYDYLDGTLTNEKRAAIQGHLDHCSPCLGAYDFEAELRQVVARRCRDEVPESLRIRIFEAIEAEIVIGEDPFAD
ncbi:MAG: mycothiol system anti-sigma-R factor [Acidimicrobiales bacterium]